MNIFNLQRAVDVLAHIELEPERWNQGAWLSGTYDPATNSCKTAFCFAGWAVALNDPTIDDTVRDRTIRLGLHEVEYRESGDISSMGTIPFQFDRIDEGRPEGEVAQLAVKILNLNYDEAVALFHWENELDDLYAHVAKLAGISERHLGLLVGEAMLKIKAGDTARS